MLANLGSCYQLPAFRSQNGGALPETELPVCLVVVRVSYVHCGLCVRIGRKRRERLVSRKYEFPIFLPTLLHTVIVFLLVSKVLIVVELVYGSEDVVDSGYGAMMSEDMV